MSELGPNAFGEMVEPGRVDCYLALPLPPDEEGVGGVLVVALRWLLHPAVPQPAGSLVYELATGHPHRQAGELVFPADLTGELRAWPQERWAALGVDLDQVTSAVVGCWQRGDFRGLHLTLDPSEDSRALTRPAMTLARAQLRAAGPAGRPRPAALAAPEQRPPARRQLPVAVRLRHPAAIPGAAAAGGDRPRRPHTPPRECTAVQPLDIPTGRWTPDRTPDTRRGRQSRNRPGRPCS